MHYLLETKLAYQKLPDTFARLLVKNKNNIYI